MIFSFNELEVYIKNAGIVKTAQAFDNSIYNIHSKIDLFYFILSHILIIIYTCNDNNKSNNIIIIIILVVMIITIN